MEYLLLIHQGSTPTPYSDDWDSVDDETKQAIYRDYQALNENPKVTPGMHLQPPETATTVEQPVEDPATGDLRAEHERGPDPLIVVSAASLAAGGSALGLRRLAARARAMR